jgi:hypothetical protein
MEKIRLTNGLEFVILSKLKLDTDKYLYLSSYNTNDIHFAFAKFIDEHSVELVEDDATLARLVELVDQKIESVVNQ